jgi:biotin carboxylase
MTKASEGGGGKGIRMVSQADAFKNAYHAVQEKFLVGSFSMMDLCHFADLYIIQVRLS